MDIPTVIFGILWAGGLGVGLWVLRSRPSLALLHTGIYLLFLPVWFPPEHTTSVPPALYVDVSRSMDTPQKRTWRDTALQVFRERFPDAPVYAFAETTVPYARHNTLRGWPTHSPRIQEPGLVLTDGYWESSLPARSPLFPWLPPTPHAGDLALDAPVEAPPGPLTLQITSPQPGTLWTGIRAVPVPAGTSSVRLTLSPGFHRLVLRIPGDSLVHPLWVPPSPPRIGVYTARPHPDVGALRRALQDLGYDPVVVWDRRTYTASAVLPDLPDPLSGWILLDPPPPELPRASWTLRMHRALEKAQWRPHPVYRGVRLARIPGVFPDTLNRITLGEATYGWLIGNVYRWALRDPEGFRDTLQTLIQDLLQRHPTLDLFPVIPTASPGDTLTFWLFLRPSDAAQVLPPEGGRAYRRTPELWEIRIPVHQEGPLRETLRVRTPSRTLPLLLEGQGVPTPPERPRPGYHLSLLQAVAFSTGGQVLFGSEALRHWTPLHRTRRYPPHLFLLPLLGGLILLWGWRYREGRP